MNKEKDLVIEGAHYRTGSIIRLTVKEGRVVSVDPRPVRPAGRAGLGGIAPEVEEPLPVIAPGLVDLQVNGYMGVDFNGPDLTSGQVETACQELLRRGVTAFWPTLITGPPERIGRNLKVIAAAVREDGLAGSMIGGIHLEGPFISPEEGPRGAHPLAYCRMPDLPLVEQWQHEAEGLVRMITLAPELPGGMELIRECRSRGMVVAIGHTGAGPGVISGAAGAGASLSTHLGNGCHEMIHRHSNYIWEQLADDRLHATLIADGFHLSESVLRVFLRAKGERAMLVSDCMPYAGLGAGVYESPATGKVVLTPEGKLHLEGQEQKLAGSATDLIEGVRRTARITGFAAAWDMASVLPARFMDPGNPAGLLPGAPADLVLLDLVQPGQAELEVRIRSVIKRGIEKIIAE